MARFLLAFGFLLISACGPAPSPAPTPTPPPQLATDPSLQPLVTSWLQEYIAGHGTLPFDLVIQAPRQASSTQWVVEAAPPQGPFSAALGREGIAVIVNSSVAQRDFTLSQLQAVFSGQVDQWDSLDNGTGKIQPVVPLEGDPVRDSFETQVMHGFPFDSRARLSPSPQEAIDIVNSTPGAIGLLPFGAVGNGMRVIRVEGQLPDQAGIRTRSYPLTFAVVVSGPSTPPSAIYDFLTWLQAKALPPAGRSSLQTAKGNWVKSHKAEN